MRRSGGVSTRQSTTALSRYTRKAKRQEQHLGFPLTRPLPLLRANYFSIRLAIGGGAIKRFRLAPDNASLSMPCARVCISGYIGCRGSLCYYFPPFSHPIY